MKKTLLYSLFALGISATTLTSCEDAFGDFLNKQPSNELTGEQVFGDWALTEQFHFDTYNFLRHGAHRINNSWLDAATDLGHTSFSTGGVRTTFNIGNYYGGGGANELTSTWEHYYRGIRKCNMLITRINDVPKPADLAEEEYNRKKTYYISEARFLRAFFYWEMFLRYGPVPIVTEVLDPDGDLLSDYTERPSIEEFVVNFIMKELSECETGLLDQATVDVKKDQYAGQITQPMACALYSRIALYMASPRFAAESGITWQDAADAAKRFIDTYGTFFRLMEEGNTPIERYTNAILNTTYTGHNSETIFFRNDGGYTTWSGISMDSPTGEGGNGGLCPTQNLVDMYDMVDGSAPFAQYDATGAPVYNGLVPTINAASGYTDATMWENRDPRLKATILTHGTEWGNKRPSAIIDVTVGGRDNMVGNANNTKTGYYVCKYIPEGIINDDHSGRALRLWIFIRYAEILLNYAEALNELGDPNGLVPGLLDQIRHRAGITGNVADRTDLSTKEAMRNFIRKERTVEFAYEEHRWWDVRRWNVAVEALSRPIYGVNVSKSGNGFTISRKKVEDRVFKEHMYLYPIPEAEVWKTNIENNPGW